VKFSWIILLYLCNISFGQVVDSVSNKGIITNIYPKTIKPEIFTNGFVDVMNNGQMNASARVFKLYLGEPGKFVLPISLYTGVSSNGYNSVGRSNETLILNIINPLSGIFNISLDGTHYFTTKEKGLTKFGFLYQVGERLLSYTDLQSFQTITFTNSYANAGLIFQTGAWEKNKTDNMGVFWISYRILIASSNTHIRSFFGPDYIENYVYGFSVGLGIEINRVVSIKGFYYRYLGIENAAFKIPIFQFSFNYSMR